MTDYILRVSGTCWDYLLKAAGTCWDYTLMVAGTCWDYTPRVAGCRDVLGLYTKGCRLQVHVGTIH